MTPRDRRALMLGAGVILGALFVLRVMPIGVRAVTRLRARARESLSTVARAQDLLARAPAVHDSLAQVLAAIVTLAPKLVDGQSSADAQASLSGLVNAAAGRHGLKVAGLDPLPDSAVGVFVRVALHATLEGDSQGLARFVRAVETGDPMLTIPALAVAAADPVGRAGAPEVLRLELDVSGYYLPRSTP